jgi:hypothetical protein
MKKIHHEEIDYDLIIEYHRMQCPLTCGDKVRGMVTDDTGTTHTFPGEGHVVAVESEITYGPGIPKHRVYLKTPSARRPGIIHPIDPRDTPPTVSDGGR